MRRTVRDCTFDLMRRLGLTTVVGNPGSTEEPFLQDFPKDFDYVLALQEASVIGVADGLSQGLRKPVVVNVHTGAGLGNAMGCILTAYQNKTPLIITAGQQTRAMLLIEPLLTNIDATDMPRPWVKWSYEPSRPEDVPGAFMRAYAVAMQPPCGPVFLSLPLDDWNKEIDDADVLRSVSTRVGPDPRRVEEFAQRINDSRSPLLVYGSDIARAQAWDAGVRFAEKLNAPVWAPPMNERTSFPESHPLYAGALPPAIGPLGALLAGHDLVIVVGAPVFRYYPYVAGPYLPDGARLLHVTDDPAIAAKAAVGDSIVSDSLLFLEDITPRVASRPAAARKAAAPRAPAPSAELPLSPAAVFETIAAHTPADFVLVEESPSNVIELQRHFPIDKPDVFYTFASGGLGWDMPAAVGLALAERKTGRNRPVIAIMGDGSFQYSVQALYTAVRQKAHVVFIALLNEEYAILKEFAQLEKTPNVPGLDLPGLDLVSLGKGYGARSVRAETVDQIAAAFRGGAGFRGDERYRDPDHERAQASVGVSRRPRPELPSEHGAGARPAQIGPRRRFGWPNTDLSVRRSEGVLENDLRRRRATSRLRRLSQEPRQVRLQPVPARRGFDPRVTMRRVEFRAVERTDIDRGSVGMRGAACEKVRAAGLAEKARHAIAGVRQLGEGRRRALRQLHRVGQDHHRVRRPSARHELAVTAMARALRDRISVANVPHLPAQAAALVFRHSEFSRVAQPGRES
jgi:benzoylformate decarboxylase